MAETRYVKYRCFQCGAMLNIRPELPVRVVFTSSIAEGGECALSQDGRTIHRCPLHPKPIGFFS